MQYSLLIGPSSRELARVIPDKGRPGHWQVRWRDGELSAAFAQLSTARVYAERMVAANEGMRNTGQFHWRTI
jgi:hypothetical protein